MTFQRVPPEQAKAIRTRGTATAALLRGEMLHYPDQTSHFNSVILRKRYKVRVRTRRDGDGGTYWWVEPLE